MFKLDIEKAEESEIKLPTPAGSSKKQEGSEKNFYFCFIDSCNYECANLRGMDGIGRLGGYAELGLAATD